MEEETLGKVFLRSFKRSWILVLLLDFVIGAIRDTSWIQAYANFNWGLMGLELVIIALFIEIGVRLYFISPTIFGFCLVRIINRLMGKRPEYFESGSMKGKRKMEGGNINLMGTNVKYFGVAMCLLVMTALPSITQWEEKIFRAGTLNWQDAIYRSIIFGLVHMLVGVPLFGAVVIGCAGIFFSYMYFQGGVELSTQAHFQYDAALVSLLLIGVTIRSISSLLEKKS